MGSKYKNFTFRLEWQPERQTYLGVLFGEDQKGKIVPLSLRAKNTNFEYGRSLLKPEDCFVSQQTPDGVKNLLQAIVNEAAKIGVVANNAHTETVSTKRHLHDMRAIAFHLLKIQRIVPNK